MWHLGLRRRGDRALRVGSHQRGRGVATVRHRAGGPCLRPGGPIQGGGHSQQLQPASGADATADDSEPALLAAGYPLNAFGSSSPGLAPGLRVACCETGRNTQHRNTQHAPRAVVNFCLGVYRSQRTIAWLRNIKVQSKSTQQDQPGSSKVPGWSQSGEHCVVESGYRHEVSYGMKDSCG